MPRTFEAPAGDVFGQYASDAAFNPTDPRLLADPYGIKAMRGDGNPGFHGDSTLFDQGHDVIDEASGMPFMAKPTLETEALGLEGMRIVELQEDKTAASDTPEDDTIPSTSDDNDMAAAWLKEHGYTW